MASAARIPLRDGALTVGSRGDGATAEETVAWCRVAACALEGALERRRLEAELLAVQRAQLVGDLAAGLVHDLNNVLTGVVGFGAILRSDLVADPSARRYAEMIESLGASGVDLTRQLLGFARCDDGAARPVDVNGVARDVCSLMAPTVPPGIELALDLREALPAVRCEPLMLQQALTNLVLNAVDAMPGGGRILLRTWLVAGSTVDGGREPCRVADAPQVAIAVVDQGAGIPPEALPRIFEPFFTTKERGRGTGLGLTSVRRIAQRHGGSVQVESEPGAGATFTLRLPVAG